MTRPPGITHLNQEEEPIISKEITANDDIQGTRAAMVKPLPSEVAEHLISKGYAFEDSQRHADAFVDYYTSNGWKVGKNPMKCWKSAASGWARRGKDYEKGKRPGNQGIEHTATDTSWAGIN